MPYRGRTLSDEDSLTVPLEGVAPFMLYAFNT